MKAFQCIPLALLCGLTAALLPACASTSDFTIETGMVGQGGSFQYRGPDGFVWGFSAEGRDLHLQRADATLVVTGVVPGQGISYRHDAGLERPNMTFLVPDGDDVVWNDDTVTVADETHRFGEPGSTARIGSDRPAPDSSSDR